MRIERFTYVLEILVKCIVHVAITFVDSELLRCGPGAVLRAPITRREGGRACRGAQSTKSTFCKTVNRQDKGLQLKSCGNDNVDKALC